MHCADTSFLCSLYRQQSHSELAIVTLEDIGPPIVISPFLSYEFRQAARFQVFLRSTDASKGYLETEAMAMFAQLDLDLDSGVVVEAGVNYAEMAKEVERLSERYTMKHGARSFDLLHIASALQWQASAFLSFDVLQREIASAEGLNVLPLMP